LDKPESDDVDIACTAVLFGRIPNGKSLTYAFSAVSNPNIFLNDSNFANILINHNDGIVKHFNLTITNDKKVWGHGTEVIVSTKDVVHTDATFKLTGATNDRTQLYTPATLTFTDDSSVRQTITFETEVSGQSLHSRIFTTESTDRQPAQEDIDILSSGAANGLFYLLNHTQPLKLTTRLTSIPYDITTGSATDLTVTLSFFSVSGSETALTVGSDVKVYTSTEDVRTASSSNDNNTFTIGSATQEVERYIVFPAAAQYRVYLTLLDETTGTSDYQYYVETVEEASDSRVLICQPNYTHSTLTPIKLGNYLVTVDNQGDLHFKHAIVTNSDDSSRTFTGSYRLTSTEIDIDVAVEPRCRRPAEEVVTYVAKRRNCAETDDCDEC
jgi:hypothetical protein